MIVSCPGCSTHYAHHGEAVLQMARCSQCDEAFPLAEIKRCYVVGPATPTPSSRPDPLLESAMEEAAALVDRPAPVAPEAVEEPVAPAPPRFEEGDEGFFGDGLNDDEALFGIEEESAAETRKAPAPKAPKRAAAPAPAPAPRRHPVREFFGLLLLSGLGAAAGFQGSLQFGFEPQNAVAAGLGAGLTLGWAWIRWVERKR